MTVNTIATRKEMLELLSNSLKNDVFDTSLLSTLSSYFLTGNRSKCTSCNKSAIKINLINFWVDYGEQELNELNNVK